MVAAYLLPCIRQLLSQAGTSDTSVPKIFLTTETALSYCFRHPFGIASGVPQNESAADEIHEYPHSQYPCNGIVCIGIIECALCVSAIRDIGADAIVLVHEADT